MASIFVFVNYCSRDVPGWAVLLTSALARRFGESRVFLDNRSVEPGSVFDSMLLDSVRRSTVLLVLVGPQWTSPERLQLLRDENDWIRREILMAWEHEVTVIPVLVDRTDRLDATLLPPELALLSRLQYLTLRTDHAHADIAELVRRLLDLQPSLEVSPRPRADDPEYWRSLRQEIDERLRHVLPWPQRWNGDRRLLTDVALSVLAPNDRLRYMAPCWSSHAMPGSAVVLVTDESIIVADFDGHGRVNRLVRLPQSTLIRVALVPRRRRWLVATTDVDVHTVAGDVITIAGLRRVHGEHLTALLLASLSS